MKFIFYIGLILKTTIMTNKRDQKYFEKNQNSGQQLGILNNSSNNQLVDKFVMNNFNPSINQEEDE